jgi:NAD(P)H-hydrate epimerase
MRAAEEAVFARGLSAETLMDQAGAGIARVVERFFPRPGRCIVFVGKGHNGGDALVAAEHLRRNHWMVEPRLIFDEQDCSELTRRKLQSFRAAAPSAKAISVTGGATIILDGLLGLGAKPPLREPVRTACREINRMRKDEHAYTIAVDLPTGIDGDSGKTDRDAVVADFTVVIGFAKRGLVADSALNHAGRLEVVELPHLRRDELLSQGAALSKAPSTAAGKPPLLGGRAKARPSEIIATATSLRHLIPHRKYDAYKNQFGRIGIVAGSKGFSGAAIICSLGALRAGAGLVEIFVSEDIYEIVAAAAPPEAMVKPVKSYDELLNEAVDVWGIGPGLGTARAAEILELIEKAKQPMVVDADGLNILAKKMSALKRCKGLRLLTPHPGEMKRLFGKRKETRAQIAGRFCKKFPVTLLFKGSRTIVAERARPISCNTTGNPGMATGGMGDILTGVCAGLIGQKLSPYDAARMGAWLCGRAAEIAIFNDGASEQSLLPRDVLDHLGEAFNDLRGQVGR